MTPETNIPTQSEDDGLASVSPEYRQALGDAKSVNELAKNYAELQQKAQHSIRVPTESSSDEDVLGFNKKMNDIGYVHTADTQAMYNTLGRPASVDGYVMPDENSENEFQNYYKEFREKAHEIGITNKQMEAMIAYDKEQVQRAKQDINLQMENSTNTLKKMYGTDLENRSKGVNIVVERLAQLDNEAATQLSEYAKLNPLVFKLLADAYETGSETYSRTPVGNVRYNITPDEAKVEIEDMLANPRSGVFDNDKHALEKLDTLFMKKHGLA